MFFQGTNECFLLYDIYLLSNYSYDEKGNISLNFGQEKEVANTVLVWGGISSAFPKAFMCRVTGKFDSKAYKNIIQQYVLPLSNMESSKQIGLVHDW